MNSAQETHWQALVTLVHDAYERAGALAWVALALILAVCILLAVLVLRWIRFGGLSAGARQRFFDRQREIHDRFKER
jgi:hypothetical protein